MRAVKTRLCESILNLCGICLLLIAFVIGAGVLMHLFGMSQLIAFETPHWLVGRAITFNSLMGIQVLLFAFAIMLAIAPVMWLDRHVRVDVFHSRLPARYRSVIDIVGHALFGIPFFAFLLLPAYRFAERSYITNERSTDGGLTDIYVIKATLPIGITLFLAVLVYLLARRTWLLISGGGDHA
ncbi:TRAP transporter small permease subunit [Vreelandella olivaria]|uniref:TRAP transporter small permease subunit n=1 Tax=Vreelandella olivaria TaxID=390919 RepID=UPI00201F56AD|nr:TRAP transporter small permease subunit [Halomonas olivaria]